MVGGISFYHLRFIGAMQREMAIRDQFLIKKDVSRLIFYREILSLFENIDDICGEKLIRAKKESSFFS